MKIYTEIVYTWDDNKGELVEESSKSYDYEGPVSRCDRRTKWGVSYAHSHTSVADVATGITGGLQDLGGAITGGVKDVWTAAETAAKVAKDKTSAAWTGMQNQAGDWWDKGAEGITDLWKGTGLEDMAAKWTDKAAMKESWMPGKWDWDSSFQSRWMMGIDMRKNLGRMQGFDWRDYKRNLYADFDTFTKNAAAAAADPVGTITGGLDEAGSIVGGGIDEMVGNIETNLEGAGDTLGVDQIIGGLGDAATGIGESALGTVESLGSDISGGIEKVVQNVEGGLADNSGVLGNLEDKINANISGINEDIETGIDENTDTLNTMEDTINSNISDFNTGLGNLQAVVHDTSTIINQGFDASININNPNSLITNPQGWYDANIEGLRQGSGKTWWDWASGKDSDSIARHGAENLGKLFTDYGEVLGGLFGGLVDIYPSSGGVGGDADTSTASQLAASRRNKQGLEGDPFGNPSETRRLVPWKKTFQSKQRNTAPSLINA